MVSNLARTFLGKSGRNASSLSPEQPMQLYFFISLGLLSVWLSLSSCFTTSVRNVVVCFPVFKLLLPCPGIPLTLAFR